MRNSSAAPAAEVLAHGHVLQPPPRTLTHANGENQLGMGCGAVPCHHQDAGAAPASVANPCFCTRWAIQLDIQRCTFTIRLSRSDIQMCTFTIRFQLQSCARPLFWFFFIIQWGSPSCRRPLCSRLRSREPVIDNIQKNGGVHKTQFFF